MLEEEWRAPDVKAAGDTDLIEMYGEYFRSAHDPCDTRGGHSLVKLEGRERIPL